MIWSDPVMFSAIAVPQITMAAAPSSVFFTMILLNSNSILLRHRPYAHAGCSVFHHVLLGFQADAEGILEICQLLCGCCGLLFRLAGDLGSGRVRNPNSTRLAG
jgi:hypothetical protein